MSENKSYFYKPIELENSIQYSNNAIVSKTIIEKKTGSITLFAFDEGQNLSEHQAPYDALVQIIDGEAEIYINKKINNLQKSQMIIMPANIPHEVKANKKFKMILTMIKD